MEINIGNGDIIIWNRDKKNIYIYIFLFERRTDFIDLFFLTSRQSNNF